MFGTLVTDLTNHRKRRTINNQVTCGYNKNMMAIINDIAQIKTNKGVKKQPKTNTTATKKPNYETCFKIPSPYLEMHPKYGFPKAC